MKILVIATGWHFSFKFYEDMVNQIIPTNWEVDYHVVAHREPDDKNTIVEKDIVRNANPKNFWEEIDKLMYEEPINVDEIKKLGW